MAYTLKSVPEDFIVEEIPGFHEDPAGQHLILKVTKREFDTEEVAQLLARRLSVARKTIGYAGTKDRHAVTTQYFSVRAIDERAVRLFSHEKIALEVVGRSREPLTLGDLGGNRFTIVVRNLAEKECLKQGLRTVAFPNYFGEQRFSTHNTIVGKQLVRKEFSEAAAALREHLRQEYARLFLATLEKRPEDAVGALNLLPRHILLMYVHSYQSLLWNEVLATVLRRTLADEREVEQAGQQLVYSRSHEYPTAFVIPILGFWLELPSLDSFVRAEYESVLAREQVGPRDFIIKQLQGMTSEGGERASIATVKDLSVAQPTADEHNEGKFRQTLRFSLPKGCYATVLLRALYP